MTSGSNGPEEELLRGEARLHLRIRNTYRPLLEIRAVLLKPMSTVADLGS
jgi:hypothetical protein